MNFDFLSAIKNIAPMLAGTFGTPLLGLAVNALCSTLPDDQAKALKEANTADPVNGALGKLGDLFQQGVINTAQIKAAELKHVETMAELGYKTTTDLEKIAADDRASARHRQETVKDATPATLAFVLIGGFLSMTLLQLIALMFFPAQAALIPQSGWLLIGNISGYLAGEAKQAGSFYFGTTANSRAKDDTIAEIAKAP